MSRKQRRAKKTEAAQQGASKPANVHTGEPTQVSIHQTGNVAVALPSPKPVVPVQPTSDKVSLRSFAIQTSPEAEEVVTVVLTPADDESTLAATDGTKVMVVRALPKNPTLEDLREYLLSPVGAEADPELLLYLEVRLKQLNAPKPITKPVMAIPTTKSLPRRVNKKLGRIKSNKPEKQASTSCPDKEATDSEFCSNGHSVP